MKPEAREELAVRRLFAAAGGITYVLSGNGRPGEEGGTRQTPGLADLWVFFPAIGRAAWFETKSAAGLKEHRRLAQAPLVLTWSRPYRLKWEHAQAQRLFGERCLASGVAWGLGTVAEAQALLVELGLAVEDPTFRLVRKQPAQVGRPLAEVLREV